MHQCLQSVHETDDMEFNMLKWMSEKCNGKMTPEEISTFSQVFCYKPANTVCSPEPLRYISEAPTELPEYLAEFTTDKGIIKPGPPMKQCQAREDYVHSYLACKESVICTVCQKDVCRFCIVQWKRL